MPALDTVLLALLTLSPVLAVLVGSFRPQGLPLSAGWTVKHYVDVWTAGATYLALLQTIIFAVCSGAFAKAGVRSTQPESLSPALAFTCARISVTVT